MNDAATHETERHGIRVGRATADDRDGWDDLVRSSHHGTVFHRHAALSVLEEQSGTTLHPLVGRKGQEPVGVLPLFVYSRGGVRAVLSPPPRPRIPFLGPALCNVEGLKYRRKEKRHRRFVGAALAWIGDVVAPRYVHVWTPPGYPDPRPFRWEGFDVTPRYTYRVDLTPGTEALLDRFSSDARRNAVETPDGVSVRVGGRTAVTTIMEQVRRRCAEENESVNVPDGFVTALYDRLADGAVRPYVCEVDGEYAGGILTLQDGDTVFRWQGGVTPDVDVPVNDLLDWQIMQNAIDEGHRTYDLVGANTPHLCEYKAKFAPDLVTSHSLERAGPVAKVAAEAYRRFRRRS